MRKMGWKSCLEKDANGIQMRFNLGALISNAERWFFIDRVVELKENEVEKRGGLITGKVLMG